MATAAALRFTESVESQLADLLMRICIQLQLDDGRYRFAESTYHAVWKFLESQLAVARLKPTIYPQGSMALGTTLRPLQGDEFDLDFVCEFGCSPSLFSQPVGALDLIEKTLRTNPSYRGMIERKNRCVRLNYQHKFHLDVLPACADSKSGSTCIVVPDRKLMAWTASNPKGYSEWFETRSGQYFTSRLLGKGEPIPEQEPAQQKAPLKLSVQLLKRWRDVRYKDDSSIAPPSIVLTTLAGHLYRGEQSVGEALGNFLAGSSDAVTSAYPRRIVVLNPTNPKEDFSERWDVRPNAYHRFLQTIAEFNLQWKELLKIRGIDRVAQVLEGLFGEEITKQVLAEQAREIEAAHSRSDLGMKRVSGFVTGLGGASTVAIRPHTFYGEED